MKDIFDYIKYYQMEPMKKHTSFKIGGAAKYLFMPQTSDEIRAVIDYAKNKNEKYVIIGNGSNVLFPDEGYDGIVIKICSSMNNINLDGDVISAQAGALLSRIAVFAGDNSLGGMEFAAGIPGTLGGAVVMNAGAYGGEMKDIIESVDVLEGNGTVNKYLPEDMDFGYRHSAIDGDKIVLGASIRLEKKPKRDIVLKMEELKNARLSKQPLEYPSAGSTFKRPEGFFAGKLIEDAGLKGYRVGGAMVSEKHSGFVINYDNASCADVIKIIEDIRKQVYDKFGVMLEPEVKIIK